MSADRRPDEAFAGLAVLASVESEDWREWLGQDPEALARRAMEAACRRSGVSQSIETELGLTLTDDETIAALNAQWRGKDKPTNILSFPTRPIAVGEMPGPLMGDLVLALETCEDEAAEQGKSPADHFTHLIVHGFLHLLGHDHIEDDEAERMESLEILVLSDLSIGDPYGEASSERLAQTTQA